MPPWQRTLLIMFFTQLCVAVGFSIVSPFLPLYVQDLGTQTGLSVEFWAGMVFSAQAATMMIVAPFWGALADRYGRKVMVERAAFGGAVIIFLMAFARSAEELVLLRAIQGLITGTVSAANALVAAAAPRERTGFAMGVLQVGLWSGVAVGPLLGGAIADTLGFHAAFVVTAILMVIAGLTVWLGIKEQFTPSSKAANRRLSFLAEWRRILSSSGVGLTYILRFLSGLGRTMIRPIAPLFIASLLPATAPVSTYTGLIVGVSSAAGTISAIYLGRLGDRVGHRRILTASALAAALFYIPQTFVTEASQLLILQALTGAAAGGIVAMPSALLVHYTNPGEEGAVYGLDNSVTAAARAVAPLVGSAVAVWFGLRGTFTACGLMLFLAALVAGWCLPRTRAPHQP
jgi:DHA1 family multidrug resistance protein-like MFS transporter